MVVEQSVLDEKYSEKLVCQQNIIQQLRDDLLYQACVRGLDKVRQCKIFEASNLGYIIIISELLFTGTI